MMVSGGQMGGMRVAGGGIVGGGGTGSGHVVMSAPAGPGGADGAGCVGCNVLCGTSGGGGAGTIDYVGSNRGSYTTQTQYRYVGDGCGEFDYIKPAPNYCVCIASSSILLILLALLLWFLLKDNTNTTTLDGCHACLDRCKVPGCRQTIGTVASLAELPKSGPCSLDPLLGICFKCKRFPGCSVAGPPQTCIIWGDPHILTFDKKRVDFYTAGEYWIVKSKTVFIQGAYQPTHATSGLAVMKTMAFGGPFMQGHKLLVGTLTATWDRQPILEGFPSSWNGNSLVTASYDASGSTMQDGRQGKQLHVVHLSLPLGVHVEINRWMEAAEGNYINAKITMSAQPGQDGHCGNFNGNPVDDDRLQIRQRLGVTGVEVNDMLFPGVKTPVGAVGRPDVNNCARQRLERAKAACKESEHKFIPSMSCLLDVCFGGASFAQTDAAEER